MDPSESSLRIRAALQGHRRKRVLVSSDDHGLRHLLASVLKRMNLEVVEAGLDRSSRDRVESLPGRRSTRPFDVAIVDARRRPGAALDALSPLCCLDAATLVIAGSDDVAARAAERGAAVLRIPVTAAAIRRFVQAC